MAERVAKTYGDALFALAEESGRIEELAGEAGIVKAALCDVKELADFYRHPKISPEEKAELTEQSFRGRVSDAMTGFLLLMVGNARADAITESLTWFEERVREYQKIGVATVVSATPLTDGQKQAVEEKLLATTAYESFRIDYSVDASLIGGMVLRIKDRVVDGSVRTKLDAMAKELQQVQL